VGISLYGEMSYREAVSRLFCQEILPPPMMSGGSMPCSQEFATGLQLESDESSSHPHKPFLKIDFIIFQVV
jgi:hypothetical protein